MKTRDAALRLKRFELTEKARKVASIEAMVMDFEHVVGDLTRQISAEEECTGVRDCTHFAYSTFAKSARLRRGNLLVSVADLKVKLDSAKREHAQVASELSKLEPTFTREAAPAVKIDRLAMIG
jgi:flagellar protein FliJ